MNIGVDAHVLAGKFQGSRTYLLNLYQHVLEHQEKENYHFLGHWNKDEFPYGEDVNYIDFKSHSRWKRLTFETSPLLRQNNIDLYHTTYISPIKVPCDTMVTIHDVLFETHPQYFTPQEVWRNKILVRRSAKKAKQIHTVSEFSKKAIMELYKIPENKIKIIPNGVNLDIYHPHNKDLAQQRIKDKFGVENYILTVGRIEPRKNHASLLEAYHMLKCRITDLGPLVIVGKPDFGFQEFFSKLDELNLKNDIHIIDFVDDDLLPEIYRAAKLFVYPTFAEGFGIPPIEAMASGVPVVSSNTTSIPEVIGNAGLFADPTRITDIAEQMEHVLTRSEVEQRLIQLGLKQASKWTWGNAAKAYLKALAEIR